MALSKPKKVLHLQNEAFSEPKSNEMDKRGDILIGSSSAIILVEGHSVLMHLFSFIFTILQIWFSFSRGGGDDGGHFHIRLVGDVPTITVSILKKKNPEQGLKFR